VIELVPPDTKLEADTRKAIDEKLEAAGWAVQDKQRINLMEKPGVSKKGSVPFTMNICQTKRGQYPLQ
jgi:type I site-specific restriction endonuclease